MPHQVGTFWYHAHQASASEVRRGLYGALVIEPATNAAPVSGRGADIVVAVHTLNGTPLVNSTDGVEKRAVAPGTPVRLRVINTDSTPQRYDIGGTPFKVVAIDGTDLVGPTPLRGRTLVLAAGGRYDIAFTMPPSPVKLAVEGTVTGLALSPDGTADPPSPPSGPEFDPAAYGRPAPTPFDASSHFDRTFELDVGRKPGFLDGKPGMQWSINGGIFPRVPMFMVEEGDLVRISIDNTTSAVHPMHLHGHHMLVLSRDGKPVSGSPWWSDTLNVEPGEKYEVAFRAEQPRDLDGPLPQPEPRRRGTDDAPRLHGRDDAVRDRRHGAQPPGVAKGRDGVPLPFAIYRSAPSGRRGRGGSALACPGVRPPRQVSFTIHSSTMKMSSALTGWKNPIAGTSKPTHARITCRVSRSASTPCRPSRHVPIPATTPMTRKIRPSRPDEVAEAGVDAEAVLERVLVDRLAVTVDLAGDEEGAVAGEADLEDDGDQE